MSEAQRFGVELEQQEGFEFRANAARLVAAAVANCLAASVVFCLKSKFRQNPGPVRAIATGRLERDEQGRYRIAGIDVVLSLSEKLGDMPHQERCLEQFEDLCIATESVRRGIPVAATVVDAAGTVVHETATSAATG
jgi:hypothetical protein